MPLRHKGFRKKHSGLTPYMLWLLCGPLVGHKIIQNDKKKRMYTMVLADGSIKLVHATAVNALVGKSLLEYHPIFKMFVPTVDGFVMAYEKLSKTNVQPKNFKKKDTLVFVG